MPQYCGEQSASSRWRHTPAADGQASHQRFCSDRLRTEHLSRLTARPAASDPRRRYGGIVAASPTQTPASSWSPFSWWRPMGRRPPKPVTEAISLPRPWPGSTSRWSSPANSTPNSSTCNGRVSWRCSRRAAARRPPRSARRRACARPTGCSRSTARSARSWCAASRPPRWPRSGGAGGTAGWGSPRSAVAPISIPIGTHGLHAVGAAMAAQRLGEDSVTVAFIGDGATSEGDAHEALNFAAVFQAPCMFFVQNNHWAISVPVGKQHGRAVARAPGHRLRDARDPGGRQRRAGLLRGDGRGGQRGPGTAAGRR